jgi:hypothetical protein
MRKFENLEIDEQNRILIVVLEELAAASVSTLEQAAEARGMTVAEIWSEICSDASMDECEPWSGYPARPDHPDWPLH